MDELTVTILEDGTLKIETGKIGMVNHQNAEAFLKELARQLGGKTTVKMSGLGLHIHEHGPEHAH